MINVDTLVLGAGVTGLSTASFLKGDYLILESESEVGGYCKTIHRNGFVWDYSGHFFHFKNESIKDYVCKNVDCDILEVSKISKIFYNKNFIDFPFQSNIHQLEKSEFIECLVDLYNSSDLNVDNFEEFVISKFGKGISEKFILPYNSKLYACDLSILDIDCMGRFLPKVNFHDVINSINGEKIKTYNDNFIYPKNGCFEFIKSILKRIDTSRIKLNESVINIDLKQKKVYTEKEVYKFNKLVSTLPFNKLLKLSNYQLSTNIFSYNKVVVFNLGFNRRSKTDAHWIYFPGDEIFYRVGFYDNILNTDRMSLYVEIGLSINDVVDEENLLHQVIKDLNKCVIIENHELVEHQMLILDPAYVHITKESNEFYEKWCDENNKNNIFSIGRYGSWTYCSIEDNIIEAKKLSEKI